MLDNPNDLAQVLLLGLPFWLLVAANQQQVPFRRGLASVAIGFILLATAQTGSRSALVALAVLGIFVFRHSTPANRLKFLLAGGFLVLLSVICMPETLAERYATLLGNRDKSAYDPATARAVESTQERIQLLKDSIRLTLSHPIFGVGPGQFQSYSAAMYGQQGKTALWRTSHCTYTQVSSETGFPGFFLYTGTLFMALKLSYDVYRASRKRKDLADLNIMSGALLLSLLSFAVSALFSSVAYQMMFPTLAGLSAAFYRVAKAEIVSRDALLSERSAQPAQPPGASVPRRIPASR
jgi:O-antigen ligase